MAICWCVVSMNRVMTSVVGFLLIAVTMFSGSGIINMTMSVDSGVALFFDPAVSSVNVGDRFVIAVNVTYVRNLNGWNMTFKWNATVIELDQSGSGAVEEGSLLKSSGATTKFDNGSYLPGSGLLFRVRCSIFTGRVVNTGGTLLLLHFKALAKGTAVVEIASSELLDPNSLKISHNRNQVSSISIGLNSVLHDVSVVDLMVAGCLIPGELAPLNVTVRNNGSTGEANITIRLYVDDMIENSTQIDKLAEASSRVENFSWTPPFRGVFNITIYVLPVIGEANTENNRIMRNVSTSYHDLSVSLECSERYELGELVLLEANVTNIGTFDEGNVTVKFIVDDVARNLTSIELLAVGGTNKTTYLWNPPSEGLFNVTAYVVPVSGETYLVNNNDSGLVSVWKPSAQPEILIVADDDGFMHEKGTCLGEFELALTWSGRKYDVWRESTQGRPSIDVLLRYESIIWTAGDYRMTPVDRYDVETLEAYLSKGGNLLMEGQFIAFENPPNHSDLWRSILHINLLGSNLRTEGITMNILDHAITRSLPSNLTWRSSSPSYSDAPVPYLGAYSVINFTGTDFSAISVYDGTQGGVGSVIYCSFALRWLDENWSNLLVANCANWLTRSTISTVGSRIINGALNSAHFVYPYLANPDEESGIPSGSMVYGLIKNPQKQSFDTSQECAFLSSVSNTTLALFGRENRLINYFESTTALPPIRHSFNSNESVFLSQEGSILASVRTDDVISGNSDLFAIYTFRDSNSSNTFFVMYGFSWRGMWAAEAFFANVLSKNFSKYSYTFCVFLWVDSNSNGIPELSEIILKSSG